MREEEVAPPKELELVDWVLREVSEGRRRIRGVEEESRDVEPEPRRVVRAEEAAWVGG